MTIWKRKGDVTQATLTPNIAIKRYNNRTIIFPSFFYCVNYKSQSMNIWADFEWKATTIFWQKISVHQCVFLSQYLFIVILVVKNCSCDATKVWKSQNKSDIINSEHKMKLTSLNWKQSQLNDVNKKCERGLSTHITFKLAPKIETTNQNKCGSIYCQLLQWVSGI